MLYADKAALENRTKLRLLAIRERELTLYTQNCFTIGTVAALMAGLAYSSLIYTKMEYFQEANPSVQSLYVVGNTLCMYLAIRAMAGTTMIAMFGPGKALRGPDGSMHETVDGMLDEFEKAGIAFQGSLYSFVFCLLMFAWSAATYTTLAALILTAMAAVTAVTMLRRTAAVELTFPLYSIPLVSGAFFTRGSQADEQRKVLRPEGAEAPAGNGGGGGGGGGGGFGGGGGGGYGNGHGTPPSTPPTTRSDAFGYRPLPSSGPAGGATPGDAGTPVLMADRAPPLPPSVARRHTEQQQLVADARARSQARKQGARKEGKWYQRIGGGAML